MVGLIMPGNIPGAGLQGELVVGLVAGCALMVKTATAEPIFFARFAQTLREADAEVGARVAVMNWGRAREELDRRDVDGMRLDRGVRRRRESCATCVESGGVV